MASLMQTTPGRPRGQEPLKQAGPSGPDASPTRTSEDRRASMWLKNPLAVESSPFNSDAKSRTTPIMDRMDSHEILLDTSVSKKNRDGSDDPGKTSKVAGQPVSLLSKELAEARHSTESLDGSHTNVPSATQDRVSSNVNFRSRIPTPVDPATKLDSSESAQVRTIASDAASQSVVPMPPISADLRHSPPPRLKVAKLRKTAHQPRAVMLHKSLTTVQSPMPDTDRDLKIRRCLPGVGNLFCASQIVPYLLGSGKHIEAFVRIAHTNTAQIVLLDDEEALKLAKGSITDADRGLIAVLRLLRLTSLQRVEVGESWLADLIVHGDRLGLYKDNGFDNQPELVLLSYEDFLVMARSWQQLPNPYLVSNDKLEADTPWTGVVDKLRKLGIAPDSIDERTYDELLAVRGAALDVKIRSLPKIVDNEQSATPDGSLDSIREQKHKPTMQKVEPLKTTHSSRARIFSHEHPLGRLRDAAEEEAWLSNKREETQQGKKQKSVKDKKRAEVKRHRRSVCKWISLFVICAGLVALVCVMIVMGKLRGIDDSRTQG